MRDCLSGCLRPARLPPTGAGGAAALLDSPCAAPGALSLWASVASACSDVDACSSASWGAAAAAKRDDTQRPGIAVVVVLVVVGGLASCNA